MFEGNVGVGDIYSEAWPMEMVVGRLMSIAT